MTKYIVIILVALGVLIWLLKRLNRSNKGNNSSTSATPILTLTSTAFVEGGVIPDQYTCKGTNVNPPLRVADFPPETKAWALTVQDPDSPGRVFTHWTLWNIFPSFMEIKENSVPDGALQGLNDFQKVGWGGPCPQAGTHRYVFTAYALSAPLTVLEGSTFDSVMSAINQVKLAEGKLSGVVSH